MDKAEKYDIKEASNPELTKKARKNYADNAQHNVKKYDGPKAVAATVATVMPMVKEFLGKDKKGKPKTAMDAAKESNSGESRGDKMVDIMSSISMRGTSMGSGVNMKSGCQVSKHMNR